MGGLDSFDLDAAVERLGDDVARRSRTHVEVGPQAATIDVTIVRDPVNNRYQLSVVSTAGTWEAIVDVDTGLSYRPVDGAWVAMPSSEVAIGIGSTALPGYLDRLMLGPLRPDTLRTATVEPGSTVFFPGTETIARQFTALMPGDGVPEWQLYDLSVVATLPAESRPHQLVYQVYVDNEGDVIRVLGDAAIEDAHQLVIHQLVRLVEPEPVLLPDPALIRPAADTSD